MTKISKPTRSACRAKAWPTCPPPAITKSGLGTSGSTKISSRCFFRGSVALTLRRYPQLSQNRAKGHRLWDLTNNLASPLARTSRRASGARKVIMPGISAAAVKTVSISGSLSPRTMVSSTPDVRCLRAFAAAACAGLRRAAGGSTSTCIIPPQIGSTPSTALPSRLKSNTRGRLVLRASRRVVAPGLRPRRRRWCPGSRRRSSMIALAPALQGVDPAAFKTVATAKSRSLSHGPRWLDECPWAGGSCESGSSLRCRGQADGHSADAHARGVEYCRWRWPGRWR